MPFNCSRIIPVWTQSSNDEVVSLRACLLVKYLISLWPPAKEVDLCSPERPHEDGAIHVSLALGSINPSIKRHRASQSAAFLVVQLLVAQYMKQTNINDTSVLLSTEPRIDNFLAALSLTCCLMSYFSLH